jgi:hypothetical protein
LLSHGSETGSGHHFTSGSRLQGIGFWGETSQGLCQPKKHPNRILSI